MLQQTESKDGEFEAAWRTIPDQAAPEAEDADWGINPANGEKLAGSSSTADGFVKNSGYFDAPAELAPKASSDTSVDDQIRAKKAIDRQKQKDFIMDDVKRANPKGAPKDWDARAEEKLKAAGW